MRKILVVLCFSFILVFNTVFSQNTIKNIPIKIGPIQRTLKLVQKNGKWETKIGFLNLIQFSGTIENSGKVNLTATIPNPLRRMGRLLNNPLIKVGKNLIIEVKATPNKKATLKIKSKIELKLDPTRSKLKLLLALNPFNQKISGEFQKGEQWKRPFKIIPVTIHQFKAAGKIKSGTITNLDFKFDVTIPGLGRMSNNAKLDAANPKNMLIDMTIHQTLIGKIKQKLGRLPQPIRGVLRQAISTFNIKYLGIKTSYSELISGKLPNLKARCSISLFGRTKNFTIQVKGDLRQAGRWIVSKVVDKLKILADNKVTQAVKKAAKAVKNIASKAKNKSIKIAKNFGKKGKKFFKKGWKKAKSFFKKKRKKKSKYARQKLAFHRYLVNITAKAYDEYGTLLNDFLKNVKPHLKQLKRSEKKQAIQVAWNSLIDIVKKGYEDLKLDSYADYKPFFKKKEKYLKRDFRAFKQMHDKQFRYSMNKLLQISSNNFRNVTSR